MDTVKVKELVFSEVAGESGVKTIALVDSPAIMVNWVAFNQQKEAVKYSIQDEEQRIILSPALIPDLHIPRKDPGTGETFAVFTTRKTVFEAAMRWMAEGRQNFANEMHDPNKPLDGITWFSSVVSDEKMFQNPPDFKDLPFGVWYLSGKVNNDQAWADVKSGKYKGISIEGYFDMIEAASLTVEQIEATTESILKQLN